MTKDEEDECVVFYDLDAESHSRNLMLVPGAVSVPAHTRVSVAAPTKVAGEGNGHQIFPRQQLPLFNLELSEDEAEEEKNPFESLLQQPTQKATNALALQTEKVLSHGIAWRGQSDLLLAAAVEKVEQVAARNDRIFECRGNGGDLFPILKRNQQVNEPTARANNNSSKKLGCEAADSRPARWSTSKPSPTDTKNRRKSLSNLKRRSQLIASVAKRRKSMPGIFDSGVAQNRSTLDDKLSGTCSSPKRRLLSDVLQHATLLSQQRQMNSDEVLLSEGEEKKTTNGDVILDTDHHMRVEQFAPQIFSPTKPTSTTPALSRKNKGDAVISKIRGGLGNVIRKAIRKSNRELTLLRSHEQFLLPQQSSYFFPSNSLGVEESIQNRAYIVICLTRNCGHSSRYAAYECLIHHVAAKLEKTTADELKKKHSVVLEAQFHPRTAEYFKLSTGVLLKLFEPLHFFSEHVAAGAVRKPKWFLASTQLMQVVNRNL